MDKIYNPSALWSAYNLLKHQGKRGGLWDGPRCDRALGLILSGEAELAWIQYTTTDEWCDCPDSTYRSKVCKHSIARMIDAKHDQLMAPFRVGVAA
jgi:hypothetical protein